MKNCYFRKYKGGGLFGVQLVLFGLVFGYSRNYHWSNGSIGKKIYIKLRKNTNL